MKRLFLLLILACWACAFAQSKKWSEEKAAEWSARQPWLVGSNYIPAYASNQLEMWQAETFNLDRIEMEFQWAEKLGMNTMRVFLHDLLWKQDASGFRKRIDRFLSTAKRHGIKPIFVLFDSCWDPFPDVGIQRPPRPGVHNSRWVQSPGAAALQDKKQHIRFLEYATNIVLAFADDDRVLAWDVWNEPDNMNDSSYGKSEPVNKREIVAELLPRVFEFVRSGRPSQPVTSGVWGDFSLDKLSPIQKIQLEQSDIVSFHHYGKPDDFEQRVKALQAYKRPLFLTEYMARPVGSTFEGILPIAAKYKVAAINWGFASGRSQTIYPWDSWQHAYPGPPEVWFHDIFTTNGPPFRQAEVDFIRDIIAAQQKAKAAARR
jgi:hypothetical protein